MTRWSEFLAAQGAVLDGQTLVSFGDAAAELQAAQDHAVVCDLAELGMLRVAGPDAATFLQGQLTNDVAMLAPAASQYAAWCSAKGRVLANFVVSRSDDTTFELMLPATLIATVRKRLGMFVLRSKVSIEEVTSTRVRLGIGGPVAADVVGAAFGTIPALHRLASTTTGTVMALPRGRFVATVEPQTGASLWENLKARARPAGFPAWQWLTIRAGVPVITPPTSDQFVPQAVNLDALDGISFQKGCYTGQEIVARTQYLGRLKERLIIAHVEGPPPLAGARLYSPVFDTQACGSVVNAAPAPGGGSDLVAVLQLAARDSGDVRVDAPDGRRLALLPLPYALPETAPRRGRIA